LVQVKSKVGGILEDTLTSIDEDSTAGDMSDNQTDPEPKNQELTEVSEEPTAAAEPAAEAPAADATT